MVRQPDGTDKEVNKRGFLTKKAGLDWLADAAVGRAARASTSSRAGSSSAPTAPRSSTACGSARRPRRRTSRTGATTSSRTRSPRCRWRSSPAQRLTAHYRLLEKSGRKDHSAGEGLSARTVRYLHTIIHGVLGQAVKDGLLLRNPADAATPPTAQRGEGAGDAPVGRRPARRVPGMGRGRARRSYALWHVLAMTGMRRGEALALRWRDVDLDAATVSVRRSAGMVRVAGRGRGGGRGRHQDRQAAGGRPGRRHRRGAAGVAQERGSMALQLVRPGALVFGDIEGAAPQPRARLAGSSPATWRCRSARRGRGARDPAS